VTNLKDKITNIIAVVSSIVALIQVVMGAWNSYIASNPDPTQAINWGTVIIAVAIAVIGWFTGKNADGSPKQL
jgi:uncharacterized membrane protein YqhA